MTEEQSYKRQHASRRPCHPGVLLLDILPDAGMTVFEFSDATKLPLVQLEKILNEQAPITEDIAEIIGAYFGNGPDLWLEMQAAYDDWGK